MHEPSSDGTPRDVLSRVFGYSDFRGPQLEVVTSVLARRDTLAILPTGGGKSICYQVPALLLPGVTIVVSPLISLMQDQVQALERRGVAVDLINSTLGADAFARRFARVGSGATKLLYVAPERFDNRATVTRLQSAGISLLVVDEAHCISEWGHDFRPSYQRLGKVRELLGSPQVMAVTATATPHVRRDIQRSLQMRSPAVIVTGCDRVNLEYHARAVSSPAQKDAELLGLVSASRETAIVYASTRKSVERLSGFLSRRGVNAGAYHAGLPEKRRDRIQHRFMHGQVRVLVATNAFGMGIDKPDVRLVAHHSIPGSLEAYYQEAGRAGRDGAPSRCVLLHSYADRFTHEFFLRARIPERDTAVRVVQSMLASLSPQGEVNVSRFQSSLRAGKPVSVPELSTILQMLQQSGALESQSQPQDHYSVRLLATPGRIRDELHGGRPDAPIVLLRDLWRLFGARLYGGVDVQAHHARALSLRSHTLHETLNFLESRQILVRSTAPAALRPVHRSVEQIMALVDWRSLERRRAAELSRLDAMQSYAFARGCRRAFVLRYFGESVRSRNCGACDNCRHGDRAFVARTGRR